MLDVVTTSFYIKSPVFEKDAFEHYSSELFDEWDAYIESYFRLPDYAVTLVIEEGSIKGKGKIAAAIAALYFGIGEYGDFISGLHTIHEQAKYLSDALFHQAKNRFSCVNERGNSKKSGGEIIYLQRLFERVQAGVVTPDQAVREVEERWGSEAVHAPDFMNRLASSLESAPQHPEQLTLSDDSWPECLDQGALIRLPGQKVPRGPEQPIPQHYRIEISRAGKGKKKKVKLTKIK